MLRSSLFILMNLDADGKMDFLQKSGFEFEFKIVDGDYDIVVTGYSEANKNEDDPVLAEWIKTEDGHEFKLRAGY